MLPISLVALLGSRLVITSHPNGSEGWFKVSKRLLNKRLLPLLPYLYGDYIL